MVFLRHSAVLALVLDGSQQELLHRNHLTQNLPYLLLKPLVKTVQPLPHLRLDRPQRRTLVADTPHTLKYMGCLQGRTHTLHYYRNP